MLCLLQRKKKMLQSDYFARAFLSLPQLHLPSPRETHFWYVKPDEINDDSLLNQYAGLLSPCERRSISQMNKDKVRKGALLARTLVRTTLARYANDKTSPSSLKFRKNQFGKPEVDWKHDNYDFPSLHFNVSHTSSLIACGVTTEVPVVSRFFHLSAIGIDVEEKERRMRNNVLSFARRYFSHTEIEFLHSFSDPEVQRQEFLKLWTLKEAYVKALGRGFSAAPFRDFTICIEDLRIAVKPSDASEGLTSNWQFGLFEVDSSHYAALCIENDEDTTGSASNPMKLKVWKTLPLVDDECVLDKSAVVNIAGFA